MLRTRSIFLREAESGRGFDPQEAVSLGPIVLLGARSSTKDAHRDPLELPRGC